VAWGHPQLSLFTTLLNDHINRSQFPGDCRSARLLIAGLKDNEGMGSLLVSLGGALAEALHSGRTLILSPNRVLYQGWHGDRCDPAADDHMGYHFDCIFERMSGCSYDDVEAHERVGLVSGLASFDSSRVKIADMRRAGVALFAPMRRYRELLLPGDAARLAWASTIVSHLFRPLPPLRRHADRLLRGIRRLRAAPLPPSPQGGWLRGLTAVHMRRGDLSLEDGEGNPRYPGRRPFDAQDYAGAVPKASRVVFWASDEVGSLPSYVDRIPARCLYFAEPNKVNCDPSLRLGRRNATGRGPSGRYHFTILRPVKSQTHSEYKGAGVRTDEDLEQTAHDSRMMTKATIEDMLILSESEHIVGTIQSSYDVICALLQFSKRIDSLHRTEGAEWRLDGDDIYVESNANRLSGIPSVHQCDASFTTCNRRQFEKFKLNDNLKKETVLLVAPRNIWVDTEFVSNGTVVHGALHSGTMMGASAVKNASKRWGLVSIRFQEHTPTASEMLQIKDETVSIGKEDFLGNLCTFDSKSGLPRINLDLFDAEVASLPWHPERPNGNGKRIENDYPHLCPEDSLPSTQRNIIHYVDLARDLLEFWKDSRGVSCLMTVIELIHESFPNSSSRPKKLQEAMATSQAMLHSNIMEIVLTNQWILKDPFVRQTLTSRGFLRH